MIDQKTLLKISAISYSQQLNKTPYSFLTEKIEEKIVSHPLFSGEQLPTSERQHEIYQGKKREAFTYPIIFYSFSLLFLALAVIVFFKTTNWACSLYFHNCQVVKSVTYILCLFLSLGAFGIGYASSHYPKQEASCILAQEMKKQLKVLYRTRKKEFSSLLTPFKNKKHFLSFFKTFITWLWIKSWKGKKKLYMFCRKFLVQRN